MNSDFFVSEVSFENVAKVIGFIHVFANGEKCICLFMILFFVFANISSGNDYSWIKLVLKFLLKWWVLLMCLRMVKTATVCGCLCFFCVCHCCFKTVRRMKCFIISSEKMRCLIISSEKMRLLIISSEKMKLLIVSSNKNADLFWRNYEEPHFFLKK